MRLASLRFWLSILPAVSPFAASSLALAQADAPAAPLAPLPAPPAPTETSTPAVTTSPPPPPPSAPPAEAAPAPREFVSGPAPRYRHQGFYLAAGGGVAVLSAWGSGPSGSASMTGVGSESDVAIGGTVAPGLVIGAVARTWSISGTFKGGPAISATATYFTNGQPSTSRFTLSGNASASTVELGAFLDWYPNPESGWHLGGSLGLGGMSVTDDAGTSSDSAGLAVSLYGGYQWWLGPAWSLGLVGVASGGTMSSFEDGNQNDTGYRLMPLGIGLASKLLYY
jgi:hypothetical protein